MEFPEWIDKEVKTFVVIINNEIDKVRDNRFYNEARIATENKMELLESVVHSDSCKDTWVNSRELSKEHGQFWLAASIFNSVPNPKDGPHRKKKSEITSWSKKVVKTCEELNELLNECPHEKIDVQLSISSEIRDIILTSRLNCLDKISSTVRKSLENNEEITIDKESFIETLTQNISRQVERDIHSACFNFYTKQAIDSIIKEVNRNKSNNTFWSVQVKSTHSDRGYFVRALTNAYMKISQEAHRRDVINITNATRFDNINGSKLRSITGKGDTGRDIDVVKENDLFGETAVGLSSYRLLLFAVPSVFLKAQLEHALTTSWL